MADLPITRITDVNITTSALAIERAGYGVLNVITKESNSIPRSERYRIYPNTTAVAVDHPTSSEAYKSAQTYFAQAPKPDVVMISNRYEVAQSAILQGGVLKALLPEFVAITDGAFSVSVDGVVTAVTGLDFSAVGDFDAVASVINVGLSPDAGCVFDTDKLIVTSVATGVASTISFVSSPATGTDISELMQMRSAEDGALLAQGIAAETVTASLEAIQDKAGDTFYGFQFTKEVRDAVSINGEDAVEAAADWAESQVKVFFNTTNDQNVLNKAVTTDICSKLQAKSLKRTISTFSSFPSQYPSASVAGRAFTVNFEVPDSTITLMFKQLPTVTVEDLSFSEAVTLDAKACNYMAKTAGAIFYQTGQMASGVFFDEVHGLDALENDMETEVSNVLYLASTKVPYTNKGIQRLISAMRKSLDKYRLNGLLAAGFIDDGFGGQKFLSEGYEISFVPVEQTSSSDRDMRKYSGLSFVCKGAGALHGVTINGTFNR